MLEIQVVQETLGWVLMIAVRVELLCVTKSGAGATDAEFTDFSTRCEESVRVHSPLDFDFGSFPFYKDD